MTERDWIMLATGLVGGGAFGAVITLIATKFKNRRQPIGYRKEIIDVFREVPDYPSLQAMLRTNTDINESGLTFVVNNLSVSRITIINKGNQDIEEFKFGITLGDTNKAIDLKWQTPDRHHVLTPLTPVKLRDPKKELDIAVKPFNRGEKYILNVYFTYKDAPGSIDLSTPHSTKFIEISILNEDKQERLIYWFVKVGMPIIFVILLILILFTKFDFWGL
jgi:hypothetical protein